MTIKGAGSAKTLLVTTNNGAYGVHFSGAESVRLEGFSIRSAGQGVRIENGVIKAVSGSDLGRADKTVELGPREILLPAGVDALYEVVYHLTRR